jgi:hypothetical protein
MHFLSLSLRHPNPWTGLAAATLLTLTAVGVPSDARALPLISELYYDAVGSDNGLSFVELAGAPGASLDALVLVGVNGANGAEGPTVALSGVFAADGLFVVADDAGDGTTLVPGADLIANFDFQNGPDSVVLRDVDQVFDAVGYGDFDPAEIFAGEGSAAPDAPAGSSIARRFADLDSDDNAADFEILGVPTPGSATFLPIPEPQTAFLLTVGLIALAFSGRAPGAH